MAKSWILNLYKDPLNISRAHLVTPYKLTTLNNNCLCFYKKNKYFLTTKYTPPKIDNLTNSPCEKVRMKLTEIISQRFTSVQTYAKSGLRRGKRERLNPSKATKNVFNFTFNKSKEIKTVMSNTFKAFKTLHPKKRKLNVTCLIREGVKEPGLPNITNNIKKVLRIAAIVEPEKSKVMINLNTINKPDFITTRKKHRPNILLKTEKRSISCAHHYEGKRKKEDDQMVRYIKLLINLQRKYNLSKQEVIELINQYRALISLYKKEVVANGLISFLEYSKFNIKYSYSFRLFNEVYCVA